MNSMTFDMEYSMYILHFELILNFAPSPKPTNFRAKINVISKLSSAILTRHMISQVQNFCFKDSRNEKKTQFMLVVFEEWG